MTRDELIAKLREINDRQKSEYYSDEESDHIDADFLLLAYIDDPDVSEAFQALTRWYA